MEYSVLIAVISFVILALWLWRRRFNHLASQISGPPTVPLLGNTLQYMGTPDEMFASFRKHWIESGRSNFRIWFGPLLYVIVTVPEDAQELLVNKTLLERDPYMIKILSRFGGNGLVTSKSKTWKHNRKIVAPTLQYKALETYLEGFSRNSRVLVRNLESFADGNTFDLLKPLMECTADMVVESTMGTSRTTREDEEGLSMELFHIMCQLIFERFVRPWLFFDFIYDLTSRGKEQKEGEEWLRNKGQDIVNRKLEEYRRRKERGQITEEWMKGGKSIVDHFIRSSEAEGGELDEKQMKDEIQTIFIAGMDTIAFTVSYTLIMLALHPNIQDDVLEELKDILADEDRDITLEDVKQMKCLDRVIKETMRLFPVIPVIAREVPEEVKLSNCTLPAGCMAIILNTFVHRDPRYFPDPERFDPDRFLPDQPQHRHPYSYIPFGAGPRMCVGFKYAEISMAVVLATVLRKYRVMPAVTYEDLQRLEIGLVVKPVCGFQIKMLPRN